MEPKTKAKRTYRRSKPHNKVSPAKLELIKELLKTRLPRCRIADSVGISRAHLYHLMKQYNLEGAADHDSSKSIPERTASQRT